MPKKDWRADVRLTSDVDAEDHPAGEDLREEQGSFIIAVLGDLRGASDGAPARQGGSIGDRKLIDVDRDNLEEVLSRFNVRWEGRLSGVAGQAASEVAARLAVRKLDDFHPDSIVQQLLPLKLLLEMRRALDDPARFEAVAAEIAAWNEAAPASPDAPSRGAAPPAVDVDASDLLGMILEHRDATVRLKPKDPWQGDLQRFLKEAVGPHLVRIDAARQAQLTGAVDRALGAQVRHVLHDRGFQRLESAWRSLYWLVNGAEPDVSLKIRIVQLSKEELLEDLISGGELEDSGIARLLLEPAAVAGGERPALLLGLYDFSHDLEDLAVLERMGNVGRKLRAPFVGAASPALLGLDSFEQMPRARELEQRFRDPSYRPWHILRHSSAGRWLALALPRLLVRLPYGARTEPVESFEFEEDLREEDHERLLWGNPAFAVGSVAVAAFAEAEWGLDLSRGVARLSGLPLYVYDAGGEKVAKPCAEALLQEETVEALEQAGLLPLVSYRGQDTVALPCIQSLAEPRAPLSWQ